MRELGRNVAAANHGDAFGELRELKELVTRDQVLGTGKCERHGPRPGRDQHMPGL